MPPLVWTMVTVVMWRWLPFWERPHVKAPSIRQTAPTTNCLSRLCYNSAAVQLKSGTVNTQKPVSLAGGWHVYINHWWPGWRHHDAERPLHQAAFGPLKSAKPQPLNIYSCTVVRFKGLQRHQTSLFVDEKRWKDVKIEKENRDVDICVGVYHWQSWLRTVIAYSMCHPGFRAEIWWWQISWKLCKTARAQQELHNGNSCPFQRYQRDDGQPSLEGGQTKVTFGLL